MIEPESTPVAHEPRQIAALVARMNTGWRLSGPGDGHASFKQRLIRPVREILARLFRTQETFNAMVVQYVNFRHDTLEELDELHRYRELLAARERRMDAAMAALRNEHAELTTALGVLRQQVRSRSTRATSAEDEESPASHPSDVVNGSNDANVLTAAYVGFEDQFRGSPEAIRARLTEYLPIFAGTSDVLDVGCGRGEFLRLLEDQGIRARGIDMNAAMVDVCRQKGLEASVADALSWLRAQPDGSVGGLFAAQVVEHLQPGYLTQFLEAAFDKLRPGAPIVLETINPACWFAFFESYVRDITHVRPLHPDTLKFLLVATGFQQLEIQYRAPYPAHEKLQRIPAGSLGDVAETVNANVDKLNSLLFTYLDYAAVGKRP